MKYERPDIWDESFGVSHMTNVSSYSKVYNECLLYTSYDGRGLAIIQQRYDPITKHTWWNAPDSDIADTICYNSGFPEFFAQNAKKPVNAEYPFVTIRQAMRALHIPSLEKEPWETRF